MKLIFPIIALLGIASAGFGQDKIAKAADILQPKSAAPETPVAVVARGLIDQANNVVFNARTGVFTFGVGTVFASPTLTSPILTNPTSTGAVVTQKTTVLTGDGAITRTSGIVFLEKTSIAAMTIAAPSSQDGTRITIISNTNFAHVVTFTGTTLLDGTTGANSTATFAAFKGASLTVVARGAFWLTESFNACTIAP